MGNRANDLGRPVDKQCAQLIPYTYYTGDDNTKRKQSSSYHYSQALLEVPMKRVRHQTNGYLRRR